jgi:hypothetical protein
MLLWPFNFFLVHFYIWIKQAVSRWADVNQMFRTETFVCVCVEKYMMQSVFQGRNLGGVRTDPARLGHQSCLVA